MNHKLILSTYSFKIKKFRTTKDVIINDFFDHAYPNLIKKFEEGFIQDLVGILDKTFKTDNNTHGGILLKHSYDSQNRIFDILINGGLTGIKQFLIDEDGKQTEISEKNIVGLKFFVRFWMPAQSNSGFIFIQQYEHLGLRPLIFDLIKNYINNKNFRLVNGVIKPTTTKKRIKSFLEGARVQEITILSKNSKHETAIVNTTSTSAFIKLKGFFNFNLENISRKNVEELAKEHGFSLGDRDYIFRATLNNTINNQSQERTVDIYSDSDNFNIVPKILLPLDCYDIDGYPNFEKLQNFVNSEIEQLILESKL